MILVKSKIIIDVNNNSYQTDNILLNVIHSNMKRNFGVKYRGPTSFILWMIFFFVAYVNNFTHVQETKRAVNCLIKKTFVTVYTRQWEKDGTRKEDRDT